MRSHLAGTRKSTIRVSASRPQRAPGHTGRELPRDTPRTGRSAEGSLTSNNVSLVEAIIAWTEFAVLVMGGVADAGSGAAALRGSGRCVGNVITLLCNAAARRTMRSPKNE